MFTGRRYDSETGLYYYRLRYFAPSIGRFLQPDPVAQFMQLASTKLPTRGKIPGTYLSGRAVREFLHRDPISRFLHADPSNRFLQPGLIGYSDSMNLYTYVDNNPLTWIDPWGLVPTWAMSESDSSDNPPDGWGSGEGSSSSGKKGCSEYYWGHPLSTGEKVGVAGIIITGLSGGAMICGAQLMPVGAPLVVGGIAGVYIGGAVMVIGGVMILAGY
jgi:hypothetical protein